MHRLLAVDVPSPLAAGKRCAIFYCRWVNALQLLFFSGRKQFGVEKLDVVNLRRVIVGAVRILKNKIARFRIQARTATSQQNAASHLAVALLRCLNRSFGSLSHERHAAQGRVTRVRRETTKRAHLYSDSKSDKTTLKASTCKQKIKTIQRNEGAQICAPEQCRCLRRLAS